MAGASIVVFSGLSVCAVSSGIVGSIVVKNSEKSTSMASKTSTVDCINRCDLRRVKGLPIIIFLVVLVFAAVSFVGIIVRSIMGKSSSMSSLASAVDFIGGCAL